MKKTLSSKQFEVLNVLWKSDHPLLVSEIVAISSIHISTVQMAIKKMEKLNYIEVAEIVHSKNVLARTYRAVITKKEYLDLICDELQETKWAQESLIALVEKEENPEFLIRLEEIIRNKLKRK